MACFWDSRKGKGTKLKDIRTEKTIFGALLLHSFPRLSKGAKWGVWGSNEVQQVDTAKVPSFVWLRGLVVLL